MGGVFPFVTFDGSGFLSGAAACAGGLPGASFFTGVAAAAPFSFLSDGTGGIDAVSFPCASVFAETMAGGVFPGSGLFAGAVPLSAFLSAGVFSGLSVFVGVTTAALFSVLSACAGVPCSGNFLSGAGGCAGVSGFCPFCAGCT